MKVNNMLRHGPAPILGGLEDKLVVWIKGMHAHGISATKEMVEEKVTVLCKTFKITNPFTGMFLCTLSNISKMMLQVKVGGKDFLSAILMFHCVFQKL